MSDQDDEREATIPHCSTSRGSSTRSSAASPNRKISRLESVDIGGGIILVEVDEELHSEGGERFKVARKNSLTAPTTIGGIAVEALADEEGESIDKEIKKKIAHHSPDIKISKNDDAHGSDSKSQDSRESHHIFRGGILSRYFFLYSHHLHLAFSTPSIVRIPYLAYKYASTTGSPFVFAYFLSLVLVAMPICMLETIMAQYSSLAPINIFGYCLPLIKGVGYGMVVTCSILMLITSTLLAWSSYYLFQSMQSDLPWAACPTNATPGCKMPEQKNYDDDERTFTESSYIPSDYYFQMDVLKSLEIESGDTLQLNVTLVATLLALWAIILFFVSRHEVWRVKVVSCWFSIPTLAVFLVLMISGLSLENSGKGLSEVFQINFTDIGCEMSKPDLWLDCFGQAFWSMGPCLGLLISRSSYNNFHKKIVNEVYLATIFNLIVQMILVIAVFPYAGHLYTKTIHQNLGYFFVITSYAVTEVALPHVASFVLFFCVCKNLLIHTVMLAETVTVSMADSLPLQWRSGLQRFSIDFVVCAFGFVCSFPFVTKEGIYYLTMTDTLVPWVSGATLGLLEISALTYVYGRSRIEDHFVKMQRSKTIFVSVCKFFVVPVLLALLLWVTFIGINDPITWDHLISSREESYFIFGLVLALLPLIVATLVLLLLIIKNFKNFKTLITPSSDWGSALSRHTELLMKRTRKRRDRSKPWLVIQNDDEISPDNVSLWIPYGYSWVPDGPAAKLMKEGHSEVNHVMRETLANLLIDRFSSNGRKSKLNRRHTLDDLTKPQTSRIKEEEPKLRKRKSAESVRYSKRGRPSNAWSINNFILQPNGNVAVDIEDEKRGSRF